MFKIRRTNKETREVATFLGQGDTLDEATKEGWTNAGEAFGKSSSGQFISEARIAVELPDGRRVLRTPAAFLSGPYDPREDKPAPGTVEDLARIDRILKP
jgi:hypothetical protein